VLETWIPKLGVRRVVVADDEAAGSPLARAAMTLCLPPELPVRIVALSELDAAGARPSASRRPATRSLSWKFI